MADEPEGGTKKPIESTEEKLQQIAKGRDNAVAAVKAANDKIKEDNERIKRLQAEIRNYQVKLPELEQKQQSAQEEVDNLLSQLEEEVDLGIKRIDPSGPVVQGGTAKYEATYSPVALPKQAKLSWDTGGCPFTVDDRTITVQTAAVGPGDYDISVKLEWVAK